MTNLTPEQKKAIQSWAEQRDTLLREIGLAETQLETIQKKIKESSQSLSDIQNRISEGRGRLSVFDDMEALKKDSISKEVFDLEVSKSRLQVEVKSIETEIASLYEKKEFVSETLNELHEIIKRVFAISKAAEQTLVGTTVAGKTYIEETVKQMGILTNWCEEFIAKNAQNVESANILIEKLPRHVFELRKPIVRRIIERRDVIDKKNKD